MNWREYRELMKHSVKSLRPIRHFLDWDNIPNPLQHYDGVPVLDLPASRPPPRIPALEVLKGKSGNTFAQGGAEFLSQLMLLDSPDNHADQLPTPDPTIACDQELRHNEIPGGWFLC